MMSEKHDGIRYREIKAKVLSANKHVGTNIYGQIQGLDEENKIYELGRYYNFFNTKESFTESCCENSRLCPCVYISFLKALTSEATVSVIWTTSTSPNYPTI